MNASSEPTLSVEQVVADFDLLDDWEDRYRYVIDLGRELSPLPESERSDANKVRGCASQVWVSTREDVSNGAVRLHFRGDSDAMIVKGLVALVIALFDGRTPEEIREIDAEALFARLDLRSHLTTQRSNGLRALVDRIKADAEAARVASGA
jgi:cysteine desulfuration protein SufE